MRFYLAPYAWMVVLRFSKKILEKRARTIKLKGMKIVTNGKKFRILDESGEFCMKWHCAPEGGSYESPYETYFLSRAIKQKTRWENNLQNAQWKEVKL